MSQDRVLIVGASVAGGRCAEQLRRGGHEGSIILAGEEAERPYDRPPLSKKFLRGGIERERLFLRPLAQYERLKIDLRLHHRATKLSTAERRVQFENGQAIDFDRLVIATGTKVRKLQVPGANLQGVHYLRTLDDADQIRAELTNASRVVIVGGGVIGCEVAASCREEGKVVTIVETLATPLVRAFGRDVGVLYQRMHEARGVEFRLGQMVVELVGDARVQGVKLSSGEILSCDMVVCGIGVVPCTDWLQGISLSQDGSVLVDENCQTNVPGVYAAGDLASVNGAPKIESIDNAQNQGTHVANRLLGKIAETKNVPFFWSDQFDLKLQSVGLVGDYERVVFRGDPASEAFLAFHLVKNRLQFVIGVNRLKEMGAAKKLIAQNIEVDDLALRDESVELSSLLPKAEA